MTTQNVQKMDIVQAQQQQHQEEEEEERDDIRENGMGLASLKRKSLSSLETEDKRQTRQDGTHVSSKTHDEAKINDKKNHDEGGLVDAEREIGSNEKCSVFVEEEGAVGNERKDGSENALCEECQDAIAKYCCPQCQRRTCSLICVNAHKETSGCSGKRDRTQYVGRGELDERVLLSDFKFLEEVQLAGDVAKRVKPPAPRNKLPHHLQTLIEQANRRGVHLHLLTPGMDRRRNNTSRYDGKHDILSWRVEWQFPLAKANAVDVRVREDAIIKDVLLKHLETVPGETLRIPELENYVKSAVCDLNVLMRKELTAANNPLYYNIDLSKTLKEVLSGKVMVEFPVLLVVLSKDLGGYSLIE